MSPAAISWALFSMNKVGMSTVGLVQCRIKPEGLSDTSGDRRGEVGGWKSRHSGGFAVEIPPSLSRSSLF